MHGNAVSDSAWHTPIACVGVLVLYLRLPGDWSLPTCPRTFLLAQLDQSRVPSLQRVVLRAFSGTTNPSDSLLALRGFSRPALSAQSWPDSRRPSRVSPVPHLALKTCRRPYPGEIQSTTPVPVDCLWPSP